MKRRTLPHFIVILAAAWVTHDFWWPERHVVTFDTGTYAAPNWVIGREAFLEGRLPLINDRIFGGAPHLGNPQTGTLYPPRWISYLFEPTHALNLLAASHVALLGVGMVFFARRLGMSRLAATVAGLVAVMCGASTTKSLQVEQIMVIAWLPWVLAFVHMVVSHPRRRAYAGLLSVVLSMAILSGHPQMTYELAITTAVFTASVLYTSTERRRAISAVATAVGATIFTCGLQLLSAMSAASDSVYANGRDLAKLNDATSILRVRSAMQAFFGSVFRHRSDYFAGAFEAITYVGVVAAILATVGMVAGVRERRTRSWSIPLIIMAVVGAIWSLGPRTPFFRAAFELLPGFDQGRVSTRWLVIVSLVMAVFVGHAVDAVRRDAVIKASITIGSLVLGVLAIAVVVPMDSGDMRTKISWLASAVLVGGAIVFATRCTESTRRALTRGIVAVLLIELFLLDRSSIIYEVTSDRSAEEMATATTEFLDNAVGYTIALTDDTDDYSYLLPALRPNANALFGVTSIDGYDGGVQVTSRWAASLRRFAVEPATDFPLRDALVAPLDATQMARLGVRWVLMDLSDDPTALVPDWTGPMAEDDRFSVWENPEWVAPAWAYVAATTTAQEAPDVLRESPDAFVGTAIVDRTSAALTCDSACDPRPVDLRVSAPEHLRAKVDLDRSAVVTVPRQALPGWSVTVDGEHAELVTVDGLYLGVNVSPGTHVIEWHYRPWWVTPGVIVSLLGVLVTLGLLWGRPPRWRRSTPGAPR